jgi:phage head maturation protease
MTTRRLTFSSPITAADGARRTITGRVVTFGETGHTSAGPARFEAGCLTVAPDIRLNLEHDRTRPIGRAVQLDEHEHGIDGTFRISATRAGDDSLVEAAEQLRDGLSVEVDVTDSKLDGDTLVVLAGELVGVALVTTPAIDSARVSRVAAAQETDKEGTAMDPETEIVETVDDEAVEVVEVVEASRPAPVTRTAPRAHVHASAADYMIDYVLASRGDRDAAARITAADQKVADNMGIVPKPLVGNLIDTVGARRPIVDSSRHMPMPKAGKVFSRPRIVTHTSVGVQATELTALSSTKMSITADDLTKVTYGGSLTISMQDLDWTDPAILGIVLGDLGKQYVLQTESATATALSAITAKTVVAANAASDLVIAAIYDAAAKVAAAVDDLPDTIWASPDQWQRLGSLVDASKRPIFPTVGPQNAGGTQSADSFSGNPLGLRLVVSSKLAAGSMIVGRSEYLETYEDLKGSLSVVAPDTLGFTTAMYGYFVPWVAEPGAFCKFATA